MFTLADIDAQIFVLQAAADDLDATVEDMHDGPIALAQHLRGTAAGFRTAAECLERMIARHIEAEAREAMRSAS